MKKGLLKVISLSLIVFAMCFAVVPTASAHTIAPNIAPEPGTYSGAVRLRINNSNNYVLRYTTDGTDPITSPTRLSTVFYLRIESSTALRAVLSYRDTEDYGPEFSGYYEIIPIVAPTLDLSGGTYIGPQTVSITNSDDVMGSHAAFYTVDGTDPTTSETSIKYTEPITVDSSQTIRAAFVRYTHTFVYSSSYIVEEGPLWGPITSVDYVIAKGVGIDIMPGISSNSINLKQKGNIPIAILGSSQFNTVDINAATVKIGDVGITQHKNGSLMFTYKDINNDGNIDMICNFSIPALVAGGELDSTTSEFTITGDLTGGGKFAGSDSVRIVAASKK